MKAKITFPVTRPNVRINTETGIAICKSEPDNGDGTYYTVEVPARVGGNVESFPTLAEAREAAIEQVELIRVEISGAHDEAIRENEASVLLAQHEHKVADAAAQAQRRRWQQMVDAEFVEIFTAWGEDNSRNNAVAAWSLINKIHAEAEFENVARDLIAAGRSGCTCCPSTEGDVHDRSCGTAEARAQWTRVAPSGRQFCRKGPHSCTPAVSLSFEGGTRWLHWCAEHADDASRYQADADPAPGRVAPSVAHRFDDRRIIRWNPDNSLFRVTSATDAELTRIVDSIGHGQLPAPIVVRALARLRRAELDNLALRAEIARR